MKLISRGCVEFECTFCGKIAQKALAKFLENENSFCKHQCYFDYLKHRLTTRQEHVLKIIKKHFDKSNETLTTKLVRDKSRLPKSTVEKALFKMKRLGIIDRRLRGWILIEPG